MITGYKQQKRPVQTTDEAKLAEDLITFYTRFDKRDFYMEQKRVMSETQSRSSHPVLSATKMSERASGKSIHAAQQAQTRSAEER